MAYKLNSPAVFGLEGIKVIQVYLVAFRSVLMNCFNLRKRSFVWGGLLDGKFDKGNVLMDNEKKISPILCQSGSLIWFLFLFSLATMHLS